MIGSAAVCLVR